MELILRQIARLFGSRGESHVRLFEPEDWEKLVALAPHDVRLRIEFSRCLADYGREQEALQECETCRNDEQCGFHDRLLAVAWSCRIREQAWRSGVVLTR